MKKSFIIVAIAVLVLTFAGSAWAHGGNSTGKGVEEGIWPIVAVLKIRVSAITC